MRSVSKKLTDNEHVRLADPEDVSFSIQSQGRAQMVYIHALVPEDVERSEYVVRIFSCWHDNEVPVPEDHEHLEILETGSRQFVAVALTEVSDD